MRSFLKALYFHAQEHRVVNYLCSREYQRALFGLEEAWEDFRGTLTEEQGQTLDGLLSRQFEAACLEDEASFLAGLSMGMDLARL